MTTPRYYVADNMDFVISDYNSAPPFASFLPGIAGLWGVPMWVFYANRGQGITSFGVLDKDGSIMEFHPADKAYRYAARYGFRTFLKVDGKFWEPFAEAQGLPAEMRITGHDLRISQKNPALGLSVSVEYFTVPNESFAGLARVVKIANYGRKSREIEIVDGMPYILPCGLDNGTMKTLSNLIQAWCAGKVIAPGTAFYKTRTALGDTPEMAVFERGNFYTASLAHRGRATRPGIVLRQSTVFGPVTGLDSPDGFLAGRRFSPPRETEVGGFIPSAFAHAALALKPGESADLASFAGHADGPDKVREISRRAGRPGYAPAKARENREVMTRLTGLAETRSASPEFDAYVRQNFLDNVMRGGIPENVGGRPFYVYYRAHGDMEREYNDFKVIPSYLSEGNGNYRDINQNRRSDNFFNPEVGDFNVKRFMNLIQLDGFNPLVVRGGHLKMPDSRAAMKLLRRHLKSPNHALADALARPFILGAFMKQVENDGVRYLTSRDALAGDIAGIADRQEESFFATGYWSDHWFYNLDLLESLEGIHPERIRGLLHERSLTFYDTDRYVADRGDKYVLKNGRMWQLDAVRHDPAKAALIESRTTDRNLVRTDHGKGAVYRTTLAAKLLTTAVNKAASLDARGIGIEMEAEKPGWNDSMNGLPGRFGSSLAETLELKNLCRWLAGRLRPEDSIPLPVEVRDFLDGVCAVDRRCPATGGTFEYWDRTYRLKEEFRKRTRMGVSGREFPIGGRAAIEFLDAVIKRCDAGTRKCLKKHGTYVTYFMNHPVRWKPVPGTRTARVTAFKAEPLPLYLEGFVHALKVEKDLGIVPMVRKSPLYDGKLGMYKVNAPLGKTSFEIGRAKTFPRGWLENESIWLHMEYKYLLEVLKAGQYEAFFSDFRRAVVAFMDPAVYKRSITENSSFLASSAYPDPVQHGRGYVARLTGATAEFIDIQVRMTSGKTPFTLDPSGRLRFRLSPVLPGWLFRGTEFGFRFLGSIDVTYVNPGRKNTWEGIRPISYRLTAGGREETIHGEWVPEPFASLIRDKKVGKITVTLG